MPLWKLKISWRDHYGLLCVIRLKKEVLSKKEGPSTCWWSFFDENIKTVFMAKHTHTLWWKATYLISRVSFLDNQNTRDIVNVKCTYVPWLPLTQIFLIAVSGCCHYETHTKQNDRVRTTPAPLQIDMTQIRKKKIFTLLSANAFLNDPINHELLNTVGTSHSIFWFACLILF